MTFQWWVSADKARALGCTHRARFLGVIPGFFSEKDSMWVSRSDLLNPFEDLVAWLWFTIRSARDEEPAFVFAVGKPI